jgi:hypothetical protein
MKPLSSGGTKNTIPDLPTLLAGAYAEFGWDPHTGVPVVDDGELQFLS